MARVAKRLGQFGKLLKVQVKVDPQLYEDSLRLSVYKIKGKKVLKTIEALRKTLSPGLA